MDLQLSNDAITNLNTVIGHTPQVTNNYSTTEHIVYNPDGSPMLDYDGRIIYEKSAEGTLTASSGTADYTIFIIGSPIHKLIYINWWWHEPTYNTWQTITDYQNSLVRGAVQWTRNGSGIQLVSTWNTVRTNEPWYATIRYTKV